jgi:predicted site-specific integrase-resolvase
VPIAIQGKTYYRTAEACRAIGISKNTLLRWMKEGKFGDTEYRDWRGWRLFTEAQVAGMKTLTNHISTVRH